MKIPLPAWIFDFVISFLPLYASLNSICGLSFHFMGGYVWNQTGCVSSTLCIYQVGTQYLHDVIGDGSLDHLVKVFAGFLHCTSTIFLFLYRVSLYVHPYLRTFQQSYCFMQCKCWNSYSDLQGFTVSRLVSGCDGFSHLPSDYPPPLFSPSGCIGCIGLLAFLHCCKQALTWKPLG